MVSGLELLRERHQFGDAGVFSVNAVAAFHNRTTLKQLDRLLTPILFLETVAACALVVTGPFSKLGRLALLLVCGSILALRWRRHAGGDGAEQMSLLVLLAACLAVMPWPSPTRVRIVVIFIAAQACLAYATAGIAKLFSQTWREGQALPAIFLTNNYGDPRMAVFLENHLNIAWLISWTVILYESLFPVVLLTSGWLLIAALALGVLFHLSCAVTMGLNGFLWAFPASYPCVAAFAMEISSFTSHSSAMLLPAAQSGHFMCL